MRREPPHGFAPRVSSMIEDCPPARRSPGAALRQLRESKGLTLEAAAGATHVKLRFLQALEQEDTGALLDPAYARSFLKAYARFLDADADIVEDYRTMLEEGERDPAPPAPPRIVRGNPRRWWIGPLVVVVIGSAIFFSLRSSREGQVGVAASDPFDSVGAFPDDPVFGSDTLAIMPGGQPMLPPDTLSSLQIVAVESTWVEASSDGQIRIHELLMPGEVRIIDAAREYYVTLGNAGGVELSLNGARLPPPGPRGMVVRNMRIHAEREPAEP